MREIKFRAYDKSYREYQEVNNLNELVKSEYPDLRSVYTHPSHMRGDERYKELYETRKALLENREQLETVVSGKMYYGVNISSNGKVMYLEGGWDFMGEEDWEVMQYTGLKDKNGKEIYGLHEINGNFRVIYRAPSFVLQDIHTGDIINMYENQDEREITGEYSPVEED